MSESISPAATPDSSVRITASNTLNYALIVTLSGALLSGVWWTAHKDAAFDTLSAKVDALNAVANKRIDDETTALNLRITRGIDVVLGRIDALEKRNETQGSSLGQLDTRLTRIESKLDYLTQNVAGPRK